MRAVHALGAPGELQSEFFLAALYRHDFPLNQVDEQIVFLTRIVEIPFVVRFPAYLRYVLLFLCTGRYYISCESFSQVDSLPHIFFVVFCF